jgi:hypothetical protein
MKKTGVNKRRFRWYKEKEKKAARICSVIYKNHDNRRGICA